MLINPPKIIKKLFPSFIWQIPSFGNSVYLTFDDGPRPEITPWVLDRLDEYGAKATFFCIGKNVELFPELFHEILKRGHAVGNHTYSHVKGWGMSTGAYINDVDTAHQLIQSNLFRPPYAQVGVNQIKMLSERYNIVMWNILSRDYSRTLSPKACLRNVVQNISPGSIIVFHDSIKCAKNLWYALPRTLEFIYSQNLICKKIEL